MQYGHSFAWLAAGVLLMAAGNRFTAIPIGAWLALTFLLRGARTTPAWPGQPCLALALYVALAFGNYGAIPVPGPPYFAVVAAITLTAVLPFSADRLIAPRIAGWASTLVFPMAWVAIEFLRERLAPYATWGSIAYTQYGNLPVMQLAALTGIWGIAFLIAWFASTVNWAWERGFAWPAVRPPVLACAALLSIVSLGGAIRVALSPRPAHPLRVAVASFPRDLFAKGEVTRIAEGRVTDDERGPFGEKLARLQDWFLASSEREARAGAQLVAWPEINLLVFREGEAAFLERARRLASDRQIYLLMGMGSVQVGVGRPLENKAVLVDPTGQVAFSYQKSRPVPGWEARISNPGDGRLPVVATAVGRIAAAICFDADFPELLRQVGQGQADLLVVPANDWEEIKHTHFQMASFRAIENGTPMLRAASSGLSGAFDPWGRVLGMTDHFSGATAMVAEIPLGAVRTLYVRVGDLFAWLCVAGSLVAIFAAFARRPAGR